MDRVLTRPPDDRHGAQGMLEGASRGLLENEFGTSNEDDVVLKILQRGSLQEFEVGLFLVLFCSPHPVPSSTTLRHGAFCSFWAKGVRGGSATPVLGEGMTSKKEKRTGGGSRNDVRLLSLAAAPGGRAEPGLSVGRRSARITGVINQVALALPWPLGGRPRFIPRPPFLD